MTESKKEKTADEKLSKKGKIAEKKLDAIEKKMNSQMKDLDSISKILNEIIKGIETKESKNKQNEVKKIPNRIKFGNNHIMFYIDFTVTMKESENLSTINGSIIYGTSRTMCFTECPENYNRKECQRNVRCDHLDDKPLIEFTVGDEGLIKSSGGLEDEWLLDDEESLREMHLRTMVHIWKDALDWSNEKLLP